MCLLVIFKMDFLKNIANGAGGASGGEQIGMNIISSKKGRKGYS